MRSKVLKPLDFSAFINGTDAMKTEQTTAERMCYIVNDKDLSQQAKEYFAQIRKTDRLINRLDSTIVYLIMVVMRRTDVKTAPGEDSWRSCFT